MARRPPPIPAQGAPPPDDLARALSAIYAEADALFAGWSCPASTECCRFGVTGREPYVTSIELAVLRRAIAARGGPRAWRRAGALDASEAIREGDPPPGPRSLPIADGERRCPMLTAEGRCSVYAARPLGCRTFYCDRAAPGGRVRHREVSALVRRVQELAARHEPGGDQGRPLSRAITDLFPKG
jgi:uncharacterized protein